MPKLDTQAKTTPDVPSLAPLAEWVGPHGGSPAWGTVDVTAFVPAFERAMQITRAERHAIARASTTPSFDNTIVPLEKSGEALRRVSAIFGVHTSTLNEGEIPEIERALAPKLAAFRDEYVQDAGLFARINSVFDGMDTAALEPVQRRLVEHYYTMFVRSGAQLSDAGKSQLSRLNQRLAQLYTRFSQNVLADETDYAVFIQDEAELAGLSDGIKQALASTSAARGKPGEWAIANTRSSMEPVLTYAAHRPLREKVWRTYYNRGNNGDDKDNNPLITEILQLRFQRAQLLGYPSHAHWALERQMAKTPATAIALMETVWAPAVQRAKEEVAAMQAIADAEHSGVRIEPWDYRYYAEKVRAKRYDLDMNEVKPYLQLEKLREGMMWAATKLFGLQFVQVEDLSVYHPDVRVWRVDDAAGKRVGLWFFDPYARPGKRSGAWMNDYRRQHRLDGKVTTIVSNNSNFVKGAKGKPALISWDDARTLFHEFGHALHGLLSDVTYPGLSGTDVPRDYVEFPSQLNEHWLCSDEVLAQFAVHHETGAPIPAELLYKIERASTFREGFDTVEYLAAALIDMKLHTAGAEPIDPDAFERETLSALGMPEEIVMRHRTPQFSHVFVGEDDYSAGYYSYLWSDALAADAAEAFLEAGGYFAPDVAQRLRAHVLSVGNTVDPADGFRAFRGRDVSTDALMRKRGFAPSSGP